MNHVKWFAGVGLEHHLLCPECERMAEGGAAPDVVRVCEECFEYATEEAGWCVGLKGEAEALIRPEPFDLALRETEVPSELGPIVDAAPVTRLPSQWLLLGEDGGISSLDLSTGEARRLASARLAPEVDHKPWAGRPFRPRLHVSSDGQFAGIVHDYGKTGLLIDLSTGSVTAHLSGGEYHNNTVPFSFAFVEIGDRVAALHRTDWNRLDLTDAATGERLTAQQEPDDEEADEFDYFFGSLHLNPSETRVAIDGWVWHPVGVVLTGALERWTHADGQLNGEPETRSICDRAYYWDGPMTWLDDDTLIVGGIGDDEERMISGARVFRIPEDHVPGEPPEIATFAGPSGTFLSDGKALYASDADGLSRWDPVDGCRTGLIAGFQPTRIHRGTGELLQLASAHVVRWARPT